MIIFLSIIIAILLLIILCLIKLYRDEKWNNLDFEEKLDLDKVNQEGDTFYRCDGCGNTDQFLEEIAEWEE